MDRMSSLGNALPTLPGWEVVVNSSIIAGIIIVALCYKRHDWFGWKKKEKVAPSPSSTSTTGPDLPFEERHPNIYWVWEKIASDWAIVGLAIFLINVILVTFPPTSDWWIGQWLKNWLYLSIGTVALILVFGAMLPKSNVPFKRKVGYVLAPIAVLYVVWFLGGEKLLEMRRLANSGLNASSGESSGLMKKGRNPITDFSFPKEFEGNEDARTAYLRWTDESVDLPLPQAYEMWMTCGTESGWRQFEEDGETPTIGYNEGKKEKGNENGAIGFCQIKPENWGDKAKELDADLGTLEGNLKVAIWIRKNDPDWESKWELLPQVRAEIAGSGAYTTTQSLPSTPPNEDITVPVGKWSKLVILKPWNCQGTPDKKMLVRGSLGDVHEMEPGNIPSFNTDTVQYMTDAEPAGKVELRCR